MTTENAWSSQDFIRALKANSDPPVPGGLSKVEIAQQAWNDPSFYIPSKAEVIADWVLTRLVKDKSKEVHLNPIFDTRYWELVNCVVGSRDDVDPRNTRRSYTWLTSLLHRLSLGPVVASFLTSFNDVEEGRRREIVKLVASCFPVLWPIAVQKMSTENLQECFGALLCAISTEKSDPGLLFIARSVSSSYRNSLVNSSNKKKLYQSFLQSHLKNWIVGLAMYGKHDDKTVKIAVLDAGLDTVFNIDILRQTNDFKTENPLVETLRKLMISERDLVLDIIPDLFDHYVAATKRHRGALFSQGSQIQPGAGLQEFHEAILHFFTTLLGFVDEAYQDALSWKSRLSLLKTVNEQNIFDRRQIEAHMTFNKILELIIVALSVSWEENQGQSTSLAVQCLSTIARIDYDLIVPFISRTLPLFLQIPTPAEENFAFLDIMLNYHTKTRTMNSLIESHLSSITNPATAAQGPREQYQLFFSSPIMHGFYLERLSKALQIFLTEGQCISTINTILALLKHQWEMLEGDAHGEGPNSEVTPRKKLNGIDEDKQEKLTVTYSLICRFSSVVLSSLPVASLSAETMNEVQKLLVEGRSGFLQNSITKSIKRLKKRTESELWRTEVALAANIRLLYALNVSKNPSLPHLHDEKLSKRVADLTLNEELLPELVIELYRNLLLNLSVGNPIDHDEIIGRLVQYLSNHFTPTDVQWSGFGHQLTKSEPGRAESALALAHMLVERWLPVIDHFGSSEQIEKFLKIILSIKILPSRSPRQQIQPEDLLWDLLHSAHFWELTNIRNVFLKLLDRKTAFLDPLSSKKSKPTTIIEKASIYLYLLLFPMEYFSWQLLNDLLKRAIAADLAISSLSLPDEEITNSLTIIRTFSKRAYIYCGSVAQDSDQDLSQILLHLLQVNSGSMAMNTEFVKATLDLVEIYLSKLLKSAQKNNSTQVLREALATFVPSHLFVHPVTISSPSFVLLVNLLEREFLANTLSEDFLIQLTGIHEQTSSLLLQRIETSIARKLTHQDIPTFGDLVSGWYSLLCLEKWLSSDERKAPPSLPLIGENLTSTLLFYLKGEDREQSDRLDTLCSDTFAVLLQELESRAASEHERHLDMVVAIYISFCDKFSLSGNACPADLIDTLTDDLCEARKNMDLHLTRFCRKLDVSDYGYTLSLISASLTDIQHFSPNHLLHLIHLASIMLQEHPTHSLAHIQKFTILCINACNENIIFTQGPSELRLQVLEMVSKHCSNQQAALRSVDATGIWLLLFKFLAPSQDHDQDTEVAMFHKIVSILSSLIRLRRDLVALALPHLGMILRQLILCARACRPNLGGKQTSAIMSTQPRWINAAHPLGGEEAKMLGRLLESLNAKTTVRTFASSTLTTDTQKAESLAKPFSKHAAYVLEAYIEAVNDPLCVMSLEVRRELQPGIFALCGMISEHSRDSLMMSALDTGGKATLKSVWKEYDKQRYVGKG